MVPNKDNTALTLIKIRIVFMNCNDVITFIKIRRLGELRNDYKVDNDEI